MDLKEIKKLVHFARKAGVKSITVSGVSVEFKDEILIQHRKPRAVPGERPKEDKTIPSPPPLPSLDDINNYIYGQTEAS